MAKHFKMNLATGDFSPLGGTDSLPHPGNFPLGSVESRAAARVMIATGRLRAGDRGTFKCGCTFFVASKRGGQGTETGALVQIVLDWGTLIEGHVHDYSIVDAKKVSG